MTTKEADKQRQAFREKIIESLSLQQSVSWLCRVEHTIEDEMAFARDFGVDLYALYEAMERFRKNLFPQRTKVTQRHIYLMLDKASFERLEQAAAVWTKSSGKRMGSRDAGLATLVRSIWHEAMQRPFEPALPPLPARRSRSPHGTRKVDYPVRAWISSGLHEAMRVRSKAFGVSVHRYAILCVLEVLDGRAPYPVAVRPVEMFERAAEYVLPAPAKVG